MVGSREDSLPPEPLHLCICISPAPSKTVQENEKQNHDAKHGALNSGEHTVNAGGAVGGREAR